MGTSGVFGFYKNGTSKLVMQISDAYPSCTGKDIVKFIQECTIEELNDVFNTLETTEESDLPTVNYHEVTEEGLQKYVESSRPYNRLLKVKNGERKTLLAAKDFQDSLNCEWGYIINLDENTLETYEGFQQEPNDNRYSIEEPRELSVGNFYNCKVINKKPISDLGNWLEELPY